VKILKRRIIQTLEGAAARAAEE